MTGQQIEPQINKDFNAVCKQFPLNCSQAEYINEYLPEEEKLEKVDLNLTRKRQAKFLRKVHVLYKERGGHKGVDFKIFNKGLKTRKPRLCKPCRHKHGIVIMLAILVIVWPIASVFLGANAFDEDPVDGRKQLAGFTNLENCPKTLELENASTVISECSPGVEKLIVTGSWSTKEFVPVLLKFHNIRSLNISAFLGKGNASNIRTKLKIIPSFELPFLTKVYINGSAGPSVLTVLSHFHGNSITTLYIDDGNLQIHNVGFLAKFIRTHRLQTIDLYLSQACSKCITTLINETFDTTREFNSSLINPRLTSVNLFFPRFNICDQHGSSVRNDNYKFLVFNITKNAPNTKDLHTNVILKSIDGKSLPNLNSISFGIVNSDGKNSFDVTALRHFPTSLQETTITIWSDTTACNPRRQITTHPKLKINDLKKWRDDQNHRLLRIISDIPLSGHKSCKRDGVEYFMRKIVTNERTFYFAQCRLVSSYSAVI